MINSIFSANKFIIQCPVCKNDLMLVELRKSGILILAIALNMYAKPKTAISSTLLNTLKAQEAQITSFFVGVEIVKEYFELFSKNGTPFSSYL